MGRPIKGADQRRRSNRAESIRRDSIGGDNLRVPISMKRLNMSRRIIDWINGQDDIGRGSIEGMEIGEGELEEGIYNTKL